MIVNIMLIAPMITAITTGFSYHTIPASSRVLGVNVTHQCLGRHLKTRKNKAAIIWEGEDGKRRIITYLQLFYRVNRLANLMRNKFGIKKGDQSQR